uniref:Uncharacterized protein n=1 Tax=Oryza rufipogon TaxID=4529 RepID=A0A0E0Q3G2_ORYRU
MSLFTDDLQKEIEELELGLGIRRTRAAAAATGDEKAVVISWAAGWREGSGGAWQITAEDPERRREIFPNADPPPPQRPPQMEEVAVVAVSVAAHQLRRPPPLRLRCH